MIDAYRGISPKGDVVLLQKLGDIFQDKTFLHVNSTRAGGGVAEILHRALPIMTDLGIKARWEVIEGDARFFDITKKIHNALQGRPEIITEDMWTHHEEVNGKNAAKLDLDADGVFIHDPQPAPLIKFRKYGIWIWRCHIDVSSPRKDVWEALKRHCGRYESAVFSMAKFARAMAIAEYITKTLAICMVCGAPANHTQRLVASSERVLVGASGTYEARCRHCFDPRLGQ